MFTSVSGQQTTLAQGQAYTAVGVYFMFSVFLSKRLSGTSSKVRLFPYIMAVLSTFTGIVFNCSADSEPELFLPFGSYLEHVLLHKIFIRGGSFYYARAGDPTRLSFAFADGNADAESCWRQGYDIKALSVSSLTCDTSQQKTPKNVAKSLNSVLVPYGNYLDSCAGTMRTIENGRSYLYSSCDQIDYSPFPWDYIPGRLDITDCKLGNISNEDGHLTCQETSDYSRQILSGTYLQHCNIEDTYYLKDAQQMTTVCPGKSLTQSIPDDCLGSGRDIIFQNGSLKCIQSESDTVAIHTASPYLPPGNYLLTCRKPAFFPCLGRNRQGRLVAECQKEFGDLVSASLEDGDSPCRMDQLGYVANKDGVLVCDPSYKFNDEDPTVGTDLIHTFQCNE